jgi:hypothetical protein
MISNLDFALEADGEFESATRFEFETQVTSFLDSDLI